MNDLLLPYSVDFRPIGACNLDCPFCFGPRHELPTMKATPIFQVLDFIVAHGTKSVVISGGEPTLIKELPRILSYLRSNGIKTILSTNGLLLERRINEIAPLLDWVALPLDASLSSVNQIMRVGHPRHFELVLHLLSLIRSNYPVLKIKLGTVVTKLNKDYVTNIPQILSADALPNIWKLYQVSYSNYGKDNREILYISDEDFESVVQGAKLHAEKIGLPITVYRNSERNGKYLFFDPNGNAVVIDGNDEVVIGNILTTPQEVLKAWPIYIDESRLQENIETTYFESP